MAVPEACDTLSPHSTVSSLLAPIYHFLCPGDCDLPQPQAHRQQYTLRDITGSQPGLPLCACSMQPKGQSCLWALGLCL